LRAVVKVALQSSALFVACFDDSRSRTLQLDEPRAHFRLKSLVLERQPRDFGHLARELLVVEQTRLVGKHRHAPSAVADQIRLLLRRRKFDDAPFAVDEPFRAFERIGELELGVTDNFRQRLTQASRRRRFSQLEHKPRES
jgi:hypothetical protein